MLLKLLMVIVVVMAAAVMFAGGRAPLPARRRPRAPRVPRSDDLVSCGRCGVWQPAGQPCDCAGTA